MNDSIHDPACGEQCATCGGRIGAEEGRPIVEGEETVAYVHINCD
jgi:hypothetical protein